MSTLTQEQQDKIAALVDGMTLTSGLGDKESACSIAAINLALTGELTDRIPACMSVALGRCIIRIQDELLPEIRNSKEWKKLLPQAAGTGNDTVKNEKVIKLLDEWFWDVVTKYVANWITYPVIAEDWKTALKERTTGSFQIVLDKVDEAMEEASPGNDLQQRNDLQQLSNNAVLLTFIFNYLQTESLYEPATSGFYEAKSRAAITVIRAIDLRLNVTGYMYDLKKGLEFWTKLDAPGLLKRMIEC